MAVTITIDRTTAFSQLGPYRVVAGTVTFDSSYPTGGEAATVAALSDNQISLAGLHHVIFGHNAGGLLTYDSTNQKILAYAGLDGTVTGTTAITPTHATIYGSIQGATPGTPVALTGSGTFDTLTGFTADGTASGITPAFASNKLTSITAGVYRLTFDCTFVFAATEVITFALRVDSTDVTLARCSVEQVSTERNQAHISMIVSVGAAVDISARCASTSAANLTLHEMVLTAERVDSPVTATGTVTLSGDPVQQVAASTDLSVIGAVPYLIIGR